MLKSVRGSDALVAALRGALGCRPSPDSFLMVQAPGRVNLIGEHTDYNGGHVLPMAVGHGVAVAAAPVSGARHQVSSLNFRETCSFAPGAVPDAPPAHWTRYVSGMLREMAAHIGTVPALEIHIVGDVPPGAGLSSSAALCIATGMAVEAVTGCAVAPAALARTARRVEHNYANVQCGIMDQMASRLAIPGHAVLLHCDTLAYRHIPLPSRGVRFVIFDSGVRRQLATSKYNERRRECAAALQRLRRRCVDLRTLCAADPSALDDLSPALLRRRATHVVAEEGRVHTAAQALERRDWSAFGDALVRSHESLRDSYEVSCKELDFLVDAALALPGTLGARMTGGGFGGCTINLVDASAAERLCTQVPASYRQVFGREAAAYVLGDSLQAGIIRRASSGP